MSRAGFALAVVAMLAISCQQPPTPAAQVSASPSSSAASPSPLAESPSPAPSPAGPSARLGAAMGYDPVRKVVVMFGGAAAGDFANALDDTWLWDGQKWSEARPAHNPGANSELFQMAFDAARKELLMVDGSEVWAWNGVDWTMRHDRHAPAVSFGLAYDADRHLVIGQTTGGTYAWDGAVWHTGHPLPTGTLARIGGALAWDAAHHEMVMFGGGEGGWGVTSPYSDTWVMKGGVWSRATPTTAPHGVYLNRMVYADSLKKVINYGGTAGNDGLGPQTDIWAWDGASWAQLPSSGGPPPLDEVSAAWDSARHQLVLFGGGTAEGASSDTWTWNGNSWTKHAA